MVAAVIIDYGMGNIGSVEGAIQYLGHEAVVSSDLATVETAQCLILPGVGSFSSAMVALRERRLDEAIRFSVSRGGSRLLGICLGMQLLADFGTEGGGSEGLGFIPGRVERFTPTDSDGRQLHIGFSAVEFEAPGTLFRGIPSGTDFYFVHEYRLLDDSLDHSYNLGFSEHSERFVSSFERNNIMGVQFHPEKSQTNGLALLRNFLEL